MKITPRAALGSLFVLAMAALCIRLGFWQLARLEQRRERNAAVRAAAALPPLPLDAATARALSADPPPHAWRRASASGRWDHAREMVLRGRSRQGRPGVHLVTPLLLGDGGVVMVNRGWVPAPDGATADTRALHGEKAARIDGVMQEIAAAGDAGMAPGAAGRDTTWQRLTLPAVRARMGERVLPLVLQRLPSGGGQAPPIPVPLPEPGEGNHLSYAVQWFSFAAIALVGLAILIARGRRGRGEAQPPGG
ncbi:MAG TPA: SURF1 family protein [Longimicrobium sp.]|nr:SURF1 family protein [Longimicrobium sp.]